MELQRLIEQVSTGLGGDNARAEQGVGVVFALFKEHGRAAEADALLDALPGAAALADKHAPEPAGMMAKLGGPALAGYAQMTKLGFDQEEMRAIGEPLFKYAKAVAGKDKVDALLATIPGLDRLA
jgi:hypothetical protein